MFVELNRSIHLLYPRGDRIWMKEACIHVRHNMKQLVITPPRILTLRRYHVHGRGWFLLILTNANCGTLWKSVTAKGSTPHGMLLQRCLRVIRFRKDELI